jgi:Choline/Carnitine o-acyltransferase
MFVFISPLSCSMFVFISPLSCSLLSVVSSARPSRSPAIEGGGFGPVTEDGYGIGYGVIDDGMRFAVSSYKGVNESHRFVEEIREALRDIRTVLEGLCGWAGDPIDPVKPLKKQRKSAGTLDSK